MSKKALQTNIKANTEYYEWLAKEAESSGEHDLAEKYRLLARLYKGRLE